MSKEEWSIITGASGGMGCEAVKSLAAKGENIIMACLDMQKGEAVRQEVLRTLPDARLELGQIDLADFASVCNFVQGIKDRRISRLFNNAGTMNRNRSITSDGFENTLEVNYLSTYLLTRLLIPQLTPDARIVNMVSLSCRYGRIGQDFFDREGFSQLGSYSDSKLALLLFSIELSHRCGQRVNVSDPGIVDTEMIRLDRWFDPVTDMIFRPFCKSPQNGVRPALRALEADGSLRYFVGKKDKPIPSRYMQSPYIEWLWNQTEQILLGFGIELP